jgi:hypothetical protein
MRLLPFRPIGPDPATAPHWVLMLIVAVNAIVARRYERRA